MAFNPYHRYTPTGTVVYYCKGYRFTNTNSHVRDGKAKCLFWANQNGYTESDIIKFDSILECDRYEYLKELEDKGIIHNLKHHQVIELQPEFVNANGDTIPALTYNADFVYKNGVVVVEDVKGASLFQDTRFEAVKQVFDYKFKEKGIYLKIVIQRKGEWIEWRMGEFKKSRTLIKKQSEKNKELKQDLHEREMFARKLEREKKRYLELVDLEKQRKLTSAEKKRLEELRGILKEKGVLI